MSSSLADYIGEFKASDYTGNYEFTSDQHPKIGCLDAISAYGMKPPQSMPIGRIVRFPDAHDKSGKKSGWAIYYETTIDDQTIGTCTFGSFRGDPDRITWSNKKSEYMSKAQRTWHQAKIEHARQTQEIERTKKAKEAKDNAKRLWNTCKPADKKHPYIEKKKIANHVAKQYKESIILPIYIDEELSSLQYIAEDGDKRFLPGGAIKGGYMAIDGDDSIVYICEGWATGCTIHEITGNKVYVCYQVRNLYDVTALVAKKYNGSVIKIAADNDRFTDGNPGLSQAAVVSQSFNIEVIAPEFGGHKEGTDFNDLADWDKEEAKRQLIPPKPKNKPEPKKAETPNKLVGSKGFIQDVVAYYNATSGNHQPGFAMQTALALASMVCGRYFITDQKNVTSMYFLNIGKSGVGKEHGKTVVEDVLQSVDLHHCVGGDGFTSDSAVIGMLMDTPRAFVWIDEFGRYITVSNAQGMAHQKGAMTSLMECISRPTGRLRAKNFSTFGLNDSQIESLRKRYVICPSLTICASTTPTTFYSALTEQAIQDGFLGRFIMHESTAQRAVRKETVMIDVPNNIKTWINSIQARIKRENIIEEANQYPTHIVLPFTQEAKDIQRAFAEEIIEHQNKLDELGLAELLSRTVEFAMRMSLIVALSRDPRAVSVTGEDMVWAVEYMRKAAEFMLGGVKNNLTGSEYDTHKREVLEAVKGYESGVFYRDMQIMLPFSKHKTKDLKDMLGSLMEGGLIEQEAVKSDGRGRPSILYRATLQNQDSQSQN